METAKAYTEQDAYEAELKRLQDENVKLRFLADDLAKSARILLRWQVGLPLNLYTDARNALARAAKEGIKSE